MKSVLICLNWLEQLCSYTKAEGRARKELDERVKKFHMLKGHVKSVRELYEEIEYMRDDIQE